MRCLALGKLEPSLRLHRSPPIPGPMGPGRCWALPLPDGALQRRCNRRPTLYGLRCCPRRRRPRPRRRRRCRPCRAGRESARAHPASLRAAPPRSQLRRRWPLRPCSGTARPPVGSISRCSSGCYNSGGRRNSKRDSNRENDSANSDSDSGHNTSQRQQLRQQLHVQPRVQAQQQRLHPRTRPQTHQQAQPKTQAAPVLPARGRSQAQSRGGRPRGGSADGRLSKKQQRPARGREPEAMCALIRLKLPGHIDGVRRVSAEGAHPRRKSGNLKKPFLANTHRDKPDHSPI